METLEFTVNGLSLSFAKDTLHLVSMKAGGEVWIENGPAGAACWQVLAVDREGWRVTLDGSNARQAEAAMHDGTLRLHWQGVQGTVPGLDGTAGPFEVAAEIRPMPRQPGLTAWRIRVDNKASAWTLWSITFPILSGLAPSDEPEADRLFYPEGWGTQCSGWQAMPRLQRRFRGWDFAMQLIGLSRKDHTLYLAVHDPRLTTKNFEFAPGRGTGRERRGRMAVVSFPEGMTLPANSCRLDYDSVVGVIPGDWFDAASTYGAWAREQPWACQPQEARSRVCLAGDIAAWQVMQVPEKPMDTWAESMERISRRLGVQLGIHFYNWHQIPFDTSYPDYLPARKGFRELAASLRKAGMLTMPYINARIWDINARSWRKRQAVNYAAKGSGMRLEPRMLFFYLEEYGSGQKLSPMCPATAFWQDTIVDLCRKITRDLGCDGVYLDQIAAEKAELCFDGSHGHPLGGGGYWLEGYREMIRKVRSALGPRFFLTTECNWEGAIADFDGLLMWHSHGERAIPGQSNEQLIPLFAAAYSGLARTFGSQFNRSDLCEESGRRFAARMGALLAWGAQLGWGDLTLLLEDEFAPLAVYLASLCRLRVAHRQTFTTGRMLRPPKIEPDAPAIASLWQATDGGITMFLVNPTAEPCDVAATASAAECAGRGFEAGNGVRRLQAQAGQPRCKVQMPALSAMAIGVE